MNQNPAIQRENYLLVLTISLFLFLALFCTTVVYWPGLNGPFLFDDFSNLESLSRFGGVTGFSEFLVFVFSNESGALGRPVSMLSFLISDNAWPSDPRQFKFVNLMFHLIIGLLVFYFVLRLLILASIKRSRALVLSALVASCWLLNPYNASTVLYVVQRMGQLAMLFSLLALIFYIVAREREIAGRPGALSFLFLAISMIFFSVLSKENGVLTLFYVLMLERVFFAGKVMCKMLKLFFRVGIVLPSILFLVYLVYGFSAAENAYLYRDFTMEERLLTQPRVIFDYLAYTLMIKFLGTGLFHDDFVLSTSIFEPSSTLIAWAAILLLLVAAYLVRNRNPLISFGVFFFFLSHSLEASHIPLEMYFEHRNYYPMVGVFIVFAALCASLWRILEKPIGAGVALTVLLVFSVGSGFMTKQKAELWGYDFNLYTMWATEHPDSLRAQRHYGGFLGRTNLWAAEGLDVLTDAFEKFPNSISLPLRMLVVSCIHDIATNVNLGTVENNVRFKEEDGAVTLAAKEFVQYYLNGKCSEEFEHSEITALLDKLSESSQLPGRARSKLAGMLADYYRGRGDLGAAMAYLDRVKKYSSSYTVPLQQAQYLASAGLYSEALEYIDEAYERDKNRKRSWIVPSSHQIIARLEQYIRNRI